MRSRLRALERVMVWESAETTLFKLSDLYVHRWQRAVEAGEEPPDAFDLANMIEERDLRPPGLGKTMEYVSLCVFDQKEPTVKALMNHLMLRRISY